MKYSRYLIATLVMSGSLLHAISPVLAEGTAAGTSLTNTATASYEDPTDPLKPLSTTSNPVVVTVAEVAGITISADGVTKFTGTVGAPVEAGDTVVYNYTVTNTGNDPSKLRIAGAAGITGPGTVQTIQRSDDGITWTDVPSGEEYISDSKAPGGFVKVRVIVAVTSGAAPNSNIVVTLGNTTTPGQQNVALVASGGDVYTVDNNGIENGDVANAPENGVREASAFQSVTVGATPQAFATVTKVRALAGVTAANTLEYKLGLSVAGSAPIGTNKIAEDLAATPINFNNSPNTNKILVSDAVPAGTKASSLVAPSGWTAVYTTDATGINANDAKWFTAPSSLSTVVGTITRVGFVKDGINATVVKGSPATEFTVVVELLDPTSSLKIGNIAQVFGTTKLDNTGAPNTTKPVYDESGDSNPNNFNDGGTEPATNPVTSGVVDTATITPADSDTNNTNTGTGAAGEPNVYQYTPNQGILNGTDNNPGAVGPTGDNDDFTNKSTAISTTDAVRDVNGNLPAINPGPLSFANTFTSQTTDNVSLVPQIGNLPVGTKVTINYGGNSKVYEVTATGIFNLGSTSTITPLVVTGVVAGTKVNYGVDIDLPAGTTQLTGYSLPVVAFVDSGTAGLDANDKQNTTIDRLYTGYLKVEKEARILAADGTTEIAPYSKNPTAKAAPGQLIQYRINYTNISDVAPANSGSIGLSAQNVKVTEDGAAAPNTWGVLVNGQLNTLNKPSSALDTQGVVVFNDGAKTTSDIDVTKYVDTVAGPLTGGQGGSFTFIRVVNPD